VKDSIKYLFSSPTTAKVLFLFILVSACSSEPEQDVLLGTLEWERVDVVSESAERILEIQVSEGDFVQSGQLLIVQDSERAEIRLQGLRAKQAQVAARLAELVRGPRQQEIAEARARLHGANSEVVNADQELVRREKLFSQKLASQAEVDRASVFRDGAQARFDATQEELSALLEGTTREELEQVENALIEAKSAVRLGEISVERHRIKAPRDGLVDMLPYDTGALPPIGASVATILDTSRPYTRVYVPEPLRMRIAAGTNVEIKIDGLDKRIPGVFRWISADPAFTPYYALTERDRSRLSFLAEIDLVTGDQQINSAAGVPVQVYLQSNSHAH
jgi:HlyD family secretion protein